MNHSNTPLLRKHGLWACLVVQSVWVAANLIPWAHHNADLNFQGVSGRPPLSPADQRRWFTVISRKSLQDPAPLFNEYLAGGLLSQLHHANPSEIRLSWWPALGQLESIITIVIFIVIIVTLLAISIIIVITSSWPVLRHQLIGSLASLQIGFLACLSLKPHWRGNLLQLVIMLSPVQVLLLSWWAMQHCCKVATFDVLLLLMLTCTERT